MHEVNPELAEKALNADLRNLIKKLGDGGTLSASERELMQRSLTDQAPPADLLKARKAYLVRKYITGGKLTPAEIKEAGLPDPRIVLQRQTSDTYKQSYTIYSKRYGRDVRNLKRWVQEGRKQTPPDLPPFDQPADMAEWFRRVKGREPGENLTRYEEDGEAESPREPEPTKQAEAANEPGAPKLGGKNELPPLPAMMLEVGGEVTSDLGLQQVQSLVVALYNQMALALRQNREKEFNNLIGKWQRAVQTLRSWEKDITKIQEGRGEVLRTRVVNTEIVAIFATMGQSFFNGLKSVLRKYAPELSEPEQRRLATKLRDDCFLQVRTTRYQAAWTEAQAQMVVEAEIIKDE